MSTNKKNVQLGILRSKDYTVVPNSLLWLPISNEAKLLWIFLYKHHEKTHPDLKYIRSFLGIKYNRTKDIIQELVDQNMIKVSKKETSTGNEYFLVPVSEWVSSSENIDDFDLNKILTDEEKTDDILRTAEDPLYRSNLEDIVSNIFNKLHEKNKSHIDLNDTTDLPNTKNIENPADDFIKEKTLLNDFNNLHRKYNENKNIEKSDLNISNDYEFNRKSLDDSNSESLSALHNNPVNNDNNSENGHFSAVQKNSLYKYNITEREIACKLTSKINNKELDNNNKLPSNKSGLKENSYKNNESIEAPHQSWNELFAGLAPFSKVNYTEITSVFIGWMRLVLKNGYTTGDLAEDWIKKRAVRVFVGKGAAKRADKQKYETKVTNTERDYDIALGHVIPEDEQPKPEQPKEKTGITMASNKSTGTKTDTLRLQQVEKYAMFVPDEAELASIRNAFNVQGDS